MIWIVIIVGGFIVGGMWWTADETPDPEKKIYWGPED